MIYHVYTMHSNRKLVSKY